MRTATQEPSLRETEAELPCAPSAHQLFHFSAIFPVRALLFPTWPGSGCSVSSRCEPARETDRPSPLGVLRAVPVGRRWYTGQELPSRKEAGKQAPFLARTEESAGQRLRQTPQKGRRPPAGVTPNVDLARRLGSVPLLP